MYIWGASLTHRAPLCHRVCRGLRCATERAMVCSFVSPVMILYQFQLVSIRTEKMRMYKFG